MKLAKSAIAFPSLKSQSSSQIQLGQSTCRSRAAKFICAAALVSSLQSTSNVTYMFKLITFCADFTNSCLRVRDVLQSRLRQSLANHQQLPLLQFKVLI